jgi:hypothetical protein
MMDAVRDKAIEYLHITAECYFTSVALTSTVYGANERAEDEAKTDEGERTRGQLSDPSTYSAGMGHLCERDCSVKVACLITGGMRLGTVAASL